MRGCLRSRLLETMLWNAEERLCPPCPHLERLAQSAHYFGFAVDLPAVRLELEHLAAGLARTPRRSACWSTKEGRVTLEMRSLAAAGPAPQRVAVAPGPADSSNPFLYHKTTNRGLYEAARAACPGYDDVLLLNERGEVTESTIANVAVEIDGKLCTPPVECGVLPGTLRADLLERGTLIEQRITVEQLRRSPRVFLLNSVRGLYRVQVVVAGKQGRPQSIPVVRFLLAIVGSMENSLRRAVSKHAQPVPHSLT